MQGGILITGREYYFNSDQELINSLGLFKTQVIFLECQQEFTDSELLNFIEKNIPDRVRTDELEALPPWLPKRPLVIQLLLKYAEEIFSIRHTFEDICGFWYAFLTKLCEREAKIYPALNPDTIRSVLLNLANQTRMSKKNTGSITQNDLSDAFIEAAGITPNDETAIMLQRLPSLGRISADSPDRRFLDRFILNGLRAESIIQASKSWDEKMLSKEWSNPLDQTGLSILSEYISKDEKRSELFLTMARQVSIKYVNQKGPSVRIAEVVCGNTPQNFFQPGAGRKESALLRGMGGSANKQLGEKILNKLMEEQLVTRIKGDEGAHL